MLTPDEHRQALRAFEVDRLLKLFTLEAKKHHGGEYTILACENGYKVAFGLPDLQTGRGDLQVTALLMFRTLKAALINAMVDNTAFGQGCWFCEHVAGVPIQMSDGTWMHVDLRGESGAPCLVWPQLEAELKTLKTEMAKAEQQDDFTHLAYLQQQFAARRRQLLKRTR